MRFFAANNFFLPEATWRRSFFVTLFFVTLSASLFWLDSFRAYESEIRVLVIGKTPSAATEQAVENFAELTSNLSFYEQVLKRNDLIDDDFAGYSQDKRKALWNEVVTAKRSDKSGVLIITARQDSQEKARLLAEETVKTLFSTAGFYYNIETDVDLRVVDGAIVRTTLRSPFQYGLLSVGSGFVLTWLFFWLLSVTPFFFGRPKRLVSETGSGENPLAGKRHEDFAIGAAVPFIDPRKFVPDRPKTLSFESSHDEQRIREEILAPLVTPQMPEPSETAVERMLPGMDTEILPFEFEETFEAEEIPATDAMMEEPVVSAITPVEDTPAELEVPVKTEEPTIEEYKRRLNELLAGGK